MEPSFLNLRDRSGYAEHRLRTLAANWKSKPHVEAERFAMAALGFCLRHNNQFLAHFTRALKLKPPTGWLVNVEPHDCADLALINHGSVVVVEGKLNPKGLRSHQDPDTGFWKAKGYARQIENAFPNAKSYTYIVLGVQAKKCVAQGDRWWRVSKEGWKALLLPVNSQKDSLYDDFADLLSACGVDDFEHDGFREGKLPRLEWSLKQLEKRCRAVIKILGNDGKKPEVDKWSARSGKDWYWGMEIPRVRKRDGDHYKLQSSISPKYGEALAWFGFSSNEMTDEMSDSVFADFWFYCGSKRARQKIVKRVGHLGAVQEQGVESQYLWLRKREQITQNDTVAAENWFNECLNAATRRASTP